MQSPSSKPAPHVARDLSISKSVLYRGRDEYGDRSEAGLSLEQENARLCYQVRVLEMAPNVSEILKKATTFFANEKQ